MQGLDVDEITQIAKLFVKQYIPKIIRPELLNCIEQHKKAGDHVILITGAPSFLANEIGQYIGVAEVESTHCDVCGSTFTAGLPRQHPFAEGKLAIARELCERYNVDIKATVAYGNSYNDRILLEAVGQPVAVTPDRWLRKIARSRGWEILDIPPKKSVRT